MISSIKKMTLAIIQRMVLRAMRPNRSNGKYFSMLFLFVTI
jgi:hypothetical protein